MSSLHRVANRINRNPRAAEALPNATTPPRLLATATNLPRPSSPSSWRPPPPTPSTSPCSGANRSHRRRARGRRVVPGHPRREPRRLRGRHEPRSPVLHQRCQRLWAGWRANLKAVRLCRLRPGSRARRPRDRGALRGAFDLLWSVSTFEYEDVVGRVGFEPTKAVPTDLQSAPFVHLGTDPCGDTLIHAGTGLRRVHRRASRGRARALASMHAEL